MAASALAFALGWNLHPLRALSLFFCAVTAAIALVVFIDGTKRRRREWT